MRSLSNCAKFSSSLSSASDQRAAGRPLAFPSPAVSHCPLRCTVAAELVTGCSLSHSTICKLPLQCRISTGVTRHATKSWCVERDTKNDLKYITLTHTTCTYWKFKLIKKLRGTNTLLVPQPKSWGTCLPRSPWLLRLWNGPYDYL